MRGTMAASQTARIIRVISGRVHSPVLRLSFRSYSERRNNGVVGSSPSVSAWKKACPSVVRVTCRDFRFLVNSMKIDPFSGSKSWATSRVSSASRAPVNRPAWTSRRKSLGQTLTRRTCSATVRKWSRATWVPLNGRTSAQPALVWTNFSS